MADMDIMNAYMVYGIITSGGGLDGSCGLIIVSLSVYDWRMGLGLVAVKFLRKIPVLLMLGIITFP